MLNSATFEIYRNAVEAELRSSVGSSDMPFYLMHRYHFGWVDKQGQEISPSMGKMLRPILCLSCCKAVGADVDLALPAAAAVELVHNFSLVHDDIQDCSAMRRHRLTVWKNWGVAQAINAGDSLYACAQMALLSGLSDRGVASEKVVRAGIVLANACLLLSEGQYLDILYEGHSAVSVEEYLGMIERKTSALMAAATELGALIGCDDDYNAKSMREFGADLGTAFQIVDDLKGIWGKEAATGKQQYEDIRGRKKTLPILYGMEKMRARDVKHIKALFARGDITVAEAEAIADSLRGIGAYEHSIEMAHEHIKRAVSRVNCLPDAEGKKELLEIAEFVMTGQS